MGRLCVASAHGEGRSGSGRRARATNARDKRREKITLAATRGAAPGFDYNPAGRHPRLRNIESGVVSAEYDPSKGVDCMFPPPYGVWW